MKKSFVSFVLTLCFSLSVFAQSDAAGGMTVAPSEASSEKAANASSDLFEYAFLLFILPVMHMAIEAANERG